MANTIQIKRSTTTATPASLAEGELAYSELSDNLFIGTTGNGVTNIGGVVGTTIQAYDANIVSDANYVATANDFTTTLKTKLDGVASSANNYSLPASVVHDTEASALHATEALSISGHTITLTKGDSSTETVTVPDNNTVYTHPTTTGNKHVPSGGATGQFLKYSASGTAVWAADNNTTYTVGDGGLTQKNFTTTLKTKLDGVAESANNYSLPASVIHESELSNSTSSTSTTVAANSAAVKSAYDIGNHSHPYLSNAHDASGVTATKITNWDNTYAWYTLMNATNDADSIVSTVAEMITLFDSTAETLDLMTALNAKMDDGQTIDGGTF